MNRLDYARYKAPRVHEIVQDRLLQGNLIKKPLWLDAVKMFPPIHRPLACIHHDTSRFSATLERDHYSADAVRTHPLFSSGPSLSGGLSGERLSQLERYCSQDGSRKWRSLRWQGGRAWRRAVVESSRVVGYPEDIVYVEDKLRARFYDDHPLEKSRPRIMKESLNTSREVVDGDDVARYQHELMTRAVDPLSEEEAYKLACDMFYKSRLREEEEIARLHEQARAIENYSSLEESDTSKLPEETTEEMRVSTVAAEEAWLQAEEEALKTALSLKGDQVDALRERASANRRKVSI